MKPKAKSTPWRPISTAPKDGTKFLAFEHHPKNSHEFFGYEAHDTVTVAWWQERMRDVEMSVGDGLYRKVKESEKSGWTNGRGLFYSDQWIEPTHWAPIPKLPNGKKAKLSVAKEPASVQ